MKIILNVLLVSFTAFILMACGLIDTQDDAKGERVSTDARFMIDSNFEQDAKDLIVNFYEEIYSNTSMQDLYWASEGKTVSDSLRKMLSEDMLEKWEKTKKFPIHYPRFLQIHGLMMYDYELLKNQLGEPRITTRFYERNQAGDKFSFLTEIELEAYVLLKDRFDEYYSDRAQYFDRVENLPKEDKEYIKIKARYDVAISSEDGEPKIVSALESTANRNRWTRHPLNNSFVERIPFHDLNTLEDNQEYIEETTLIRGFMENLFEKIDRPTNSIINFEWDRDALALEEYLLELGVITYERELSDDYDIISEDDYDIISEENDEITNENELVDDYDVFDEESYEITNENELVDDYDVVDEENDEITNENELVDDYDVVDEENYEIINENEPIDNYDMINEGNDEITNVNIQRYFYDMFEQDNEGHRSYKVRLNKDIFPIKPGMEKVNHIEVEFNQFPSYTSQHRSYRVKVTAWVETTKGLIDGIREYQYEYKVILDRRNEDIYIDEIRLNSYRLVR